MVGLISTRLDQKHNVKNIDLVKQQFNHSPHTVDQIQWMDQSAHKRQQLESRGGHVHLRVRVGPSQGKKDVLIGLDSSKFGTKNRTEHHLPSISWSTARRATFSCWHGGLGGSLNANLPLGLTNAPTMLNANTLLVASAIRTMF